MRKPQCAAVARSGSMGDAAHAGCIKARCTLQARPACMVEWNCRSALKPPGMLSMLDSARSMLRICSRISACTGKGGSGEA